MCADNELMYKIVDTCFVSKALLEYGSEPGTHLTGRGTPGIVSAHCTDTQLFYGRTSCRIQFVASAIVERTHAWVPFDINLYSTWGRHP